LRALVACAAPSSTLFAGAGLEDGRDTTMPTLQFKGKSVIETYHYTVPHHRLESVPEWSVHPPLPLGTGVP